MNINFSNGHSMSGGHENHQNIPRVCIVTHNPDLEVLSLTVNAIARQTVKPQGVTIVDNASSPPLDADLFDALLPHCEVELVREPLVGVAHGRLRAIAETHSQWLLFVDDDNELREDYIEAGIAFIEKHPEVGCFGGKLKLSENLRPEDWTVDLLGFLAIRDYGSEPIIKESEDWGPWEPATAGAFVHRSVLTRYASRSRNLPIVLGRQGRLNFTSGEDSLMMRGAIKEGLANAYCPDLELIHHIAPNRLEFAYIVPLMAGFGRTSSVLNSLMQPEKLEFLRGEKDSNFVRTIEWIINAKTSIKTRICNIIYAIAEHHSSLAQIETCREESLPITIVTACLNAESTIERTLKSIERQNYRNLQYIVCDGGSDDGTLNILENYSHIITHLQSEKDGGVANALNKGFSQSQGVIRCYLNADDCLKPGTLDLVSALFNADPDIDVVTGGCHRHFEDGSETVTQVPDRFLDVMSLRNDLEQPSTFWKASLHAGCGEFDESFGLAFDWEWWNRLKAAGARFKVTQQVLSDYYFSNTNFTSQAGEKVVKEMYRVTEKYGPKGVADAYMELYLNFDLKGFYDGDLAAFTEQEIGVFNKKIKDLKNVFGDEAIDAYNWNWASKQARRIKWY